MSFFDDDPPTTVSRQRPGSRRGVPGSGSPRGPRRSPDQQTLMVRRAVALGIAVIVLILIVLGIKSCVDSRNLDALKSYNRDVGTLAAESSEASRQFFALLDKHDEQGIDFQQQANQIVVSADGQARRAREIDTPGSMQPAQRNFELTMNLRAGALRKIVALLPRALGKQDAGTAIKSVAGEMEVFLASDVLYSQRVVPLIREQLDDADAGQQDISASRFLPRLDWLDSSYVAQQLGTTLAHAEGKPTPGTHGHGLTSVSVGGTTLQPGVVAHIPTGKAPIFDVSFENQGDNDEQDVKVRVKVSSSSGSKPDTATKTVASTSAGQPAEAMVTLPHAPPIGTPVQISVEVLPVPGEKVKTNNSQTYNAIFNSG